MSSDEKVLDFPRVEGTSEENARRVMIEATRLAKLAPGEWRLWIDRSAERLRIPRAILEDVIAAIIKNSEKKARDAETEARRHELAVRREQERKQCEQKREQERTDKRAENKRKEREKAFEGLISLPSEQQETRLGELAKRHDEDVAIIRDHFTAFVGMQSWTASTDSWNVELWPDPVETQKLLQKISAKVSAGRCTSCETMIFVPSSFIKLSEPISRGTVTGQRNSRTRLRVSCPTSRTSEHSSAGARGCDVRMFGCLPLDGPHREGGLLAGLRTYLPLSRTTLTQQLFGPRPEFRRPCPAASPILRVIVARGSWKRVCF